MKCDKLQRYSLDVDYEEKAFAVPDEDGTYMDASEVDEAIAELKEFAEDACLERDDNQNAIDELQKETDSAWSKVNTMYDELLNHKYKRCLAMAKWCHNQREIYERDSYNWELEDDAVNSLRNKANIMRKWRKRWLELAEKFKPNNEVNNG